MDRFQNMTVHDSVRHNNFEEDHRPWGYYQVISDQVDVKVKKIFVYPGKRLSLQRHRRRAEHWFIIRGHAIVTLDSSDIHLEAGKSIDIPQGSFHRIMNAGTENLAFIEVQTGDYFGEDDIERVEDDYGRVL
jgi:mannose-6-phosphate isomerase